MVDVDIDIGMAHAWNAIHLIQISLSDFTTILYATCALRVSLGISSFCIGGNYKQR